MARIENLDTLRRIPTQNLSAKLFGAVNTDQNRNILPSGHILDIDYSDILPDFPDYNFKRAGNYNPIDVKFSTDSVKDAEIKGLMTELYDACGRYMDNSELAKIDNAMGLMHYGHQGQSRDDEITPYTDHILNVALPLAKKHELDWETIASALCHDLLEDSEKNGFPISARDIAHFLSPDVAKTIVALSKVRFGTGEGRAQEVDDATRAVLFESLRENPRAAIIKIYDRLHNMRTIKDVLEIEKRRDKATETLKYYVPLAQFLGLYKEARTLASISLNELDLVFRKKLNDILTSYKLTMNRSINGYENLAGTDLVKAKISEVTAIPRKFIKIRMPDIYALYRTMGQKREPKIEDCFLAVDIELPDPGENFTWVEKAWSKRFELATSLDFDALNSLSLPDIKQQIMARRLQSLDFFLKTHFGHQTKLKINIYPGGGATLNQIPITLLYYHKRQGEAQEGKEESRQSLGIKKWASIISRLETTEGLVGGELGRKFLDFLLPGKLQVISIDSGGRERNWLLDEGSTVMDYVYDKYPVIIEGSTQFWQNAQEFVVNSNPVNPYYILKPDDIIFIVFANQPNIQAEWISSVVTSPDEIKEEIRSYFRTMLEDDSTSEQTYQILLQETRKIFQQQMDEELVIKLDRVQRTFDGMIPREFVTKVALGEIDDERIKIVAILIKTYQNQYVVQLSLGFAGKDREGLEASAAKYLASEGISYGYVVGSGGSTLGDRPIMKYWIDLNEVFKDSSEFPQIRDKLDRVKQKLGENLLIWDPKYPLALESK